MTTPTEAGQLHILVVDDDELDRLAVRRCLQQSAVDMRCDQAASAAEALERAAQVRYDCILLDWYLPGEDACETLGRLRETAPQAPVVIFTGRGDEDIAVELMKAGAADYLPKSSLAPERLESSIRHALRVFRNTAGRRRAESLLKLLSDAAEHVLTAADANELAQGLWEKIREPLGIDAYVNVLVDDAGTPPGPMAFAGFSEKAVSSFLGLDDAEPGGAGILAAVEPVQLENLQRSQDASVEPLKADGIRACVCHPLLAEGARLGTLCFATRQKDEFAPDELDFLRTVSQYATAACERLRRIAQMRESDRRKDEFLATLAHELRDPLAPLGNVVELMKRSPADPLVIARARETMERQLGQLVQLVDDLLDVARITRGQLQLRRMRAELTPALQQAVEVVQPLVDAAGQELEVEMPDEPVWLHADPVRLAQIFGNLLINATKFTAAGGRIRMEVERPDGEAVVKVSDSGIGLRPEELASIFDMFKRVPGASGHPQSGLGIGLTLVSRLVEMHEGTVAARSAGPGQGSEFVVRLPVLAAEPEKDAPSFPEESPNSDARRVLVVDDNRDSATSLATLLRLTGHETREAYDGSEALHVAGEFRPDIVLLDIGLPGLDGYEVCRRLRDERRGREMLIVALSGWGQAEDRRKSRAAGFDHHMVKPVRHDELTELIAAHAGSNNRAAG